MPVLAYEPMTAEDHARLVRLDRNPWKHLLDGRVWRINRHEFDGPPTIKQVQSRITSFASYHRHKISVRIESDDSLLMQYVGEAAPTWRSRTGSVPR